MDVDHYVVLGLPSGEKGAKLTEKEISKAYKLKALELHPDKRPDDPNAHSKFQTLQSSYEILKDENSRKLFDNLLKVQHEQQQQQQREQRQWQQQHKRKRPMHVNKRTRPTPTPKKAVCKKRENIGDRVIEIYWEKIGGGEDYSVEKLREVFSKLGEVENIIIKTFKEKSCAIIVMASKDGAAAATWSVCGSLSNPLT